MASDTDSAKAAIAPAPAGPSLVKTLAAVAVASLLAAGAGGAYGMQILSTLKDALAPKPQAQDHAAVRYGPGTNIKELAPIITNLANPPDSWIRLEAALVFDGKPDEHFDVMTAQINGDILAFLRTLTIRQLEGAAGLRQLREDLNERIAVRSGGKVRELIIQTLVIQ
jgi:flagellar FliL protein